MVGERGHPQAMAGGRLGVEAEQRVGVSVGGAGAAPDESGGGVQGAARQEQPRALAQRPLYAGLTTHQIERSPPMQPIAPGPAGAQVEDVGEPTIIARGRTAHVQHGAPHGGGVEAGQEPAQVEGRVDRRTVQQHQLEIGGGAAHEEHVARLGRIASPSFAPPGPEHARLSHPRPFGQGSERHLARGPRGSRHAQVAGAHLRHRDSGRENGELGHLDRLPDELEIHCDRAPGGDQHLDLSHLVARLERADPYEAGRHPAQVVTPQPVG